MKKWIALIACLFVMIPAALAIPESGGDQLEMLREIKGYLDLYHLYPTEDGTVLDVTAAELEADPALARTIAEAWLSADRYGYYMDIAEYEESFPTASSTVGIGIQVDLTMPLGTYVAAIIDNTAARRSGMEVGCQIVAVDGVDITDEPFLEVARPMIVSDMPLSKVEISYINPGETEVRTETLTRNNVNFPGDVQGTMLDEETGYISIAQFGGMGDYYDFRDIYHEQLPAQGAKNVIIDLRGNPGGELDTLLNILNAMTAEEGAFFVRMLYRDENEEFRSTGQEDEDFWQPESIVVLIDGDSYSASEVFAGALKDLDMATIIGTNSGGKSRAQYHVQLTSGDVLIFTYSDIELPKTGSYYEVGIEPHIIVEQESKTGAELELGVLGTRAFFKGCRNSARVLAFENRLAMLGYFRDTPDGVLDSYTLWCYNRFQAAQGLRKTCYARPGDLLLLDTLFAETEFPAEDAQLQAALTEVKKS